jgi:hypothetical protein
MPTAEQRYPAPLHPLAPPRAGAVKLASTVSAQDVLCPPSEASGMALLRIGFSDEHLGVACRVSAPRRASTAVRVWCGSLPVTSSRPVDPVTQPGRAIECPDAEPLDQFLVGPPRAPLDATVRCAA